MSFDLFSGFNPLPQYNAIISVQGVDSTNAVAPFIEEVRFSDRISFKPDNLEITLRDTQRIFLNEWKLGQGMKIGVTLVRMNYNYPGEMIQRNCGNFEIDQLELSYGNGTILHVLCTSVPLTSTVNTQKKARRWEGASLKSMLTQICQESHITPVYEASYNPTWTGVDQVYESDLVMLQQKAESSGLMLKVTNDSIVIFDEAEYEQKAPVWNYVYGQTPIISARFSTKSFDVYGSAIGQYMNPKTGDVTKSSFTPNNPPPSQSQLVVRCKPDYDEDDEPEDPEDDEPEDTSGDPTNNPTNIQDSNSAGDLTQQRFIKKCLRAKNKHAHKSNLVMNMEPTLCAGNVISVTGVGADFDGNWIIEDATHTISKGETDLELHKVLDPSYDQ